MFQRVLQPPLDPARRDVERHDFWPGFLVTLVGVLLVVAGARHLTRLNTVEGNNARETELIKAFACGGLEYADRMTPPEPPKPTGDPIADAAALARWDKQQAPVEPLTWKVRVDTAAKTPCPT